jgi:hypothetical protein
MVVVFGTKTNPAVEYTLFFREPDITPNPGLGR